MRQVFEAVDMLEAHVVKGILEQEGISGFIQGEYLHGGMGDLPVSGLVRIEVNDMDYEQARSVIKHWEQQQASTFTETVNHSLVPAWVLPFVIGLALGILLTLGLR